MPGQESAADGHDQQEAGTGYYFAPLEGTKCMVLTTFERDGAPVSAPVGGAVDADRAYFWAWSRSGSVRRLQHNDAVQVTPCSMRGLLTYGPPLDATARLLPGEEASEAARKLARRQPVRHRFLIPLLRRARRRQMVHYELVADHAAGDQGECPEGVRTPDQRRAQSAGQAVHDTRELARIQCAQAQVTDYGIASIACIWPATAPVASPRAGETARRSRAPAPGSAPEARA